MRNIFILVSCVLIAFTVEGQARESNKTRTVAVGYSDLDLSNQTDLQVLRQRLDRAVRKVCSSRYDIELSTRRDKQRCMNEARGTAYASIPNGHARFAALDLRPVPTLQAERKESFWDSFVTMLK